MPASSGPERSSSACAATTLRPRQGRPRARPRRRSGADPVSPGARLRIESALPSAPASAARRPPPPAVVGRLSCTFGAGTRCRSTVEPARPRGRAPAASASPRASTAPPCSTAACLGAPAPDRRSWDRAGPSALPVSSPASGLRYRHARRAHRRRGGRRAPPPRPGSRPGHDGPSTAWRPPPAASGRARKRLRRRDPARTSRADSRSARRPLEDRWASSRPEVRALVRQVEAAGGAAKISGAGSLTGPGAGSLLVYHPDPEWISGWSFLGLFPSTLSISELRGLRLETDA